MLFFGVPPRFDTDNGTHIYTYAYATYNDHGAAFRGFNISDVLSLSHEVAEFLNDPFVGILPNKVPTWSANALNSVVCSNLLEVGDPLPVVWFTANGYHLQDEAFLPWFARESPSTSINGQYTYLGTFTTFSKPC